MSFVVFLQIVCQVAVTIAAACLGGLPAAIIAFFSLEYINAAIQRRP